MINSLYVHIPFCIRKCLYCDFNSYTSDTNIQDKYMKALVKELSTINVAKFKTIFVGGGTPTILSLRNLEVLLERLTKYEALEYTFECNPGTLSMEKLNLLKKYGVNRLSIGLQAWQNNLLEDLGRIHNRNDFLESYYNARVCGFNNINLDLMFGIPNQGMEDWIETIQNAIKLKPEHISSYGLIVEEETPYYEMQEKGLLKLVNEEIERDMYYYVIDELKKNGYNQYEISNFSKPHFECKHNITYWQDEEYYGVGAGAHSYINKTRYSNYLKIDEYIHNVNNGEGIELKTNVTFSDELSEFMFLGLRRSDGISKERFKKRFNKDIYSIYSKELKELINKDLLIDNGHEIKLSSRGIDISNQVFIRFLK